MIVIYTGNNEIDRILEAEIKGSMVVGFADFIVEDNKFKGQTVIISDSAIDADFREFLYLLRSKDIRVILLLRNEKSEETKIALETGIYDLIFGNFYPSDITDILAKPRKFEDISKIYKKVFDIKIKRWGVKNVKKQ